VINLADPTGTSIISADYASGGGMGHSGGGVLSPEHSVHTSAAP